MDNMQGDGNNPRDIKDTSNSVKDTTISVKDTSIFVSTNKANKLITALYMVTDIMDTAEPIRNKLRALGMDAMTDIHSLKDTHTSNQVDSVLGKLDLILSCLDIASTVGMISGMNAGILNKEFTLLKEAIKSIRTSSNSYGKEPNLDNFLGSSTPHTFTFSRSVSDTNILDKRQEFPTSGTRIGVQKGSTLLQALSDKMLQQNSKTHSPVKHKDDFDKLKKERKNEIILIIKTKNLEQSSKGLPLGVTITDIKNSAKAVLKDTSEKTLQRELMSLIDEGVLYKEGSKRWSKYFIK